MRLAIGADHLAAIRAHASSGYPHEVCGFLLGQRNAARAIFEVRATRPGTNRRVESEARRRYLIDPREFRAVEVEAEADGLELVGVYHSHPDAPSRPSEFDRDHAWPHTAYVIVSVGRDGLGDVSAWRLADDRSRFDRLAIGAPSDSRANTLHEET